MMSTKKRTLGALTALISTAIHAGEPSGVNWPSFRGLHASGVTEGFKTPERWNVEKRENLKWKTPIPGLGHSSPVIWGNRIFVTTAVNEKGDADLKVGLYGDIGAANDSGKQRWLLICADKATGKILWQRSAHEGIPAIKRHTKATHANSTPA